MADPSAVPSAKQLASSASRKYKEITLSDLPAGAETDLEILADTLLAKKLLYSLFIDRLVDWVPFRRDYNKGHRAIADFLWCRAITLAVTTNVDELVELASKELGGVLRTSVTGAEAVKIWDHAPFLKIHGCAVRDPDNTL